MVVIDDDTLARLRDAMGPDSFADRYELYEETGRGGMGVVYRAAEREGGRQVAIKLLAADVRDHARFAQEVAILERLAHPAIVGYAHHGVSANGRAYLAMDWLDGDSLAHRLRRGPLPIDAVVAIGTRIADALAHAHAHGVLHRDLKPSNVMLVAGDPARATLIDFGVAKDVDGTTLTGTGQLVGTPAYMAPEQARGRAIDARADLFALGCVLYEALTGEAPFSGRALLDVLAQVLMREPPPVDHVRPDVPHRLEAMVAALLEKNPDHRVATADIVVAELAIIARALDTDDRTVLDRPSPAFRAHARTAATVDGRRSPARSRRWWILGIALVIAAAVVVVTWPWGARDAATAVAPASREFASGSGRIVTAPGMRAGEIAPVFVEASPADALGTTPIAETWCASRGAVIVATAEGRIASIDRAGAVTTLGTIPRPHGTGDAIVCLGSGRIIGVTRGAAWMFDGAALRHPTTTPANVIDAVAIAGTARWLTGDPLRTNGGPAAAIWEWNGGDEPRQVRPTCDHPLRLAPDGNRVACRRDSHVIVEDGVTTVEGPIGTAATWSGDGKALYVSEATVIRRWWIGSSATPEIIGGGGAVLEVGRWLAIKEGRALDLHWLGPPGSLGPTPATRRDPLDLGLPMPRLLGASLPPSSVVLAYGGTGVRVVDIEHPILSPPSDRHLGPVFGLAFDGDDLVTLDAEGRMIHHAVGDRTRRLVGELGSSPPIPIIVPRSDGVVVGGDERWPSGFVDRSGRFKLLELTDSKVIGRVLGRAELVRASAAHGIAIVASDGSLGPTLVPGPLSPNTRSVAVAKARDLALVRTGTAYAAVLKAGTGELAFSYTSHGAAFNQVALAVDTMIVGDSNGDVVAVSATGVTPLVQLVPPITAIAASPVARRFAVSSGHDVIIYDIDHQREIGRTTLDANILALAWSDDGTRVAGVASSTALAIWKPF